MESKESTRFDCTEETPWKEEFGTPVMHDRTRQIGRQRDGWPAGDIVTIECLNCGHQWEKELPQ